MDELRELSDSNNTHLTGVSETWPPSQIMGQELVILCIFCSAIVEKNMVMEQHCTSILTWRYVEK